MTTPTLQKLCINLQNFRAAKTCAYIFVQDTLKSVKWYHLFHETLVYIDAELRAAEALKFFKDVLKIEHVEVLRNLSREEIIEIIKQLERKAIEFENSKDYDTQAVNVIFVNWIGFNLD